MKKMKNLLKNNKTLYFVYRSIFNFILNILKMFIKVDKKVILFNCFGGSKYDDSTKVIFEYMREIEKYKQYKMYWALDNPEKYEIDGAIKIKNNSPQFFYIALKAKYWITNSSMERGLSFKNKDTIYINTWHGTAIKKMGKEIQKKDVVLKTSTIDYMFAQSQYDIDVFSKAFSIPREKFVLVGLPRNDELANIKIEECELIRKKLNIENDKKIILYAPTFREYQRDKDGCIIAPPIDLNKWKEKLSNKYIVLFRAHYEVNKSLGIKSDEFLYDVSNYPNLNELLKISDIMISDYSSIMFDYSILERPIYSYAYDIEEYTKKRGIYLDLASELPNGYYTDEDALLDNIVKCNFEEQKEKTKKFKRKYIEFYGNARKAIDNIIRGSEI